jgi:hypothetical protein
MYSKILLGVLLVLLLSSCEREQSWDEKLKYRYSEVLSRLVLDCDTDAFAENYMVAIIERDTMCLHEGYNGYNFRPGLGWTVTTNNNSLNIGASNPSQKFISLKFSPGNESFKEVFEIKFFGFSPDMTYEEISDSIFKVGRVPLIFEDLWTGYDFSCGWGGVISIGLRYKDPDAAPSAGNTIAAFTSFSLSSSFGRQPDDSLLQIVNVKRLESIDEIVFSVVFEFNCLLFHDYSFGSDEVFGQLDNGHMEVSFSIPRGV